MSVRSLNILGIVFLLYSIAGKVCAWPGSGLAFELTGVCFLYGLIKWIGSISGIKNRP